MFLRCLVIMAAVCCSAHAAVPKHMLPGACPTSGDAVHEGLGIHSMIVKDQVLDLAENRQLTFIYDGMVTDSAISPDGKHVAYVIRTCETVSVCTVSASGGRSTTVARSDPDEIRRRASDPKLATEEIWTENDTRVPFAWSPDSRFVAFPATRLIPGGPSPVSERCLFAVSPVDSSFFYIPLPKGCDTLEQTLWSPDGQTIAAVGRVRDGNDFENSVMAFDVAKRSARVLGTYGHTFPDLDRWLESSQTVRYSVFKDGTPSYTVWEQPLLGQPRKISEGNDQQHKVSPDGRLELIAQDRKTLVRDTQTGKTVGELSVPIYCFEAWTRDSTMLLYRDHSTVWDDAKLRQHELYTVWLQSFEAHKASTMCVTLDSKIDRAPTLSDDGMKIAYVAQDRLYVAELFKRPPTAWEKMTSGIPLSEDECKPIMQLNADLIKMSIMDYAEFHKNIPPTLADVKRGVSDEDAKKIFNRPGSSEEIFAYTPEAVQGKDDTTSIIGVLDAGFDWRIEFNPSGAWKMVEKGK